MKITISGQQLDLDERLRTRIGHRIESAIGRYFDAAIEAHVVISREGHEYRTDCSVHVGTGIAAQSHATGAAPRASFDVAAERLEKQLRRSKRKLRDQQHGR